MTIHSVSLSSGQPVSWLSPCSTKRRTSSTHEQTDSWMTRVHKVTMTSMKTRQRYVSDWGAPAGRRVFNSSECIAIKTLVARAAALKDGLRATEPGLQGHRSQKFRIVNPTLHDESASHILSSKRRCSVYFLCASYIVGSCDALFIRLL